MHDSGYNPLADISKVSIRTPSALPPHFSKIQKRVYSLPPHSLRTFQKCKVNIRTFYALFVHFVVISEIFSISEQFYVFVNDLRTFTYVYALLRTTRTLKYFTCFTHL